MKKITLTNENRKVAIELLKVQTELKALEARKKAMITDLKPIFEANGTEYAVSDKTHGIYATIQEQGEAVYILFKQTEASGGIDYKAAFESLGGTEEQAEHFRKPNTIRTTFERASEEQIKKYIKK